MAKTIASPPYDVLSSEEARAIVKDNPRSFLRVNKSEVDFPPDHDQYSDEVYRRGRENLDRFVADGLMARDVSDCFYLYRLTWKGRSQTGLLALSSVDEYDRGLIKKHEHTRPKKVNDRAHHILTVGAQVGPVFSTFRNNDEIGSLFARLSAGAPTVNFVSDDDVRHELWVVSQASDIAALTDSFGRLPALYVADGHHRSQAASEACRRMREHNAHHTGQEPYNFFLNGLFPDRELRILPYNRVITDIGRVTVEELIQRAGESFDISPAPGPVDPSEHHLIGMYAAGQWYQLRVKPGTYDSSDPASSIDSAILTANLLAPILGITDIRTDDRIDFVGGIRGIGELVRMVDSGKYRLAFSLYPVSVDQLLDVADAGQVMPPKSTWFEPKLRSGMVVNLIRE